MSSRMPGESSSATRAQFAGILNPNPPKDEISLWRAADYLLHANDHEMLGIRILECVKNGAHLMSSQIVNKSESVKHSETHAGASTSRNTSQSLQRTNADSGNSRLGVRQEARQAKEVLGMGTQTSEKTNIVPDVKGHFIASLPNATVDTAIYNPLGTFILPCHNLQINGETTLRSLITTIQDLVDLKVKSRSVQGPFVVSAIEVKLFTGEDYTGFPKIKGELKGDQHKYPNIESLSSPSSSGSYHAAASANNRGELEDKDIPSADTVHWIVGPGSELDQYWEQYRIAIQLDARRRLQPGSSSAYPRGHENKRPILKIMTVKRTGGLLGLFVGVHSFGLRESVPDKTETERQETPETPEMGQNNERGSGKKGMAKASANPNGEMIAATQDAVQKYNPRIANDVRDSDIDFAIRFARTVAERDTEQKSPATTTKLILAQMKEEGQETLSVLVQNEASPQIKKAHRWIPNWGTYQKIGGDPKMHKLFPLGNVPFEPTKLEFKVPKDEQDIGDAPLAEAIFGPGNIRPTDLVAYQHLDANFVEILMDDQTTLSSYYHREKKDHASGFDEIDDDTFLYGTVSLGKPAASMVSPLAQVPGSTEPFPNFDAQRQHEDSPLQNYGNSMHQALNMARQESPLHQNPAQRMRALGSGLDNLGDLMSKSAITSNNPLEALGQSYNAIYDYHGNPTNTNNPGYYNRAPNSQMTDVNMARNAPPGLQQQWPPMRTPSPTKNQYTHQGGANSLANIRNVQSFAAFNNLAHETHSQHQNQGFYNQQHTSPSRNQPFAHGHGQGYYVSPTKTHAQMSRAFNSAATFSSAAFNYNTGNNFSSGGMQNFASTYGNINPTLSTTPTPSFNQLNATAYSYQPQSQVQSQAQNVSMSSQIPPTSAPSQVQGSTAFYSGIPISSNVIGTNTNTFNVGAGTSRGWMASGASSTPRNARPTGGFPRRIAPGVGNSQLRADSPSFTSVVAGTNAGRGRVASGAGFLRGVHVMGADGNMVQMQDPTHTSSITLPRADAKSEENQTAGDGEKGKGEGEL